GTALVDGGEVHGPSPERGVIFQQYALFPWLTVRDNVEFGLKTARVPAAERRERAQHFFDMVGLGAFADSLPKTLSGGVKQRCAIARAYAIDPSILLMDAPFGALDALTRVRMQENLLETWEKDKRTIVFITHDVDEAAFLANRVVVMAAKPGRIHRIIDVDLPHPRTEDVRLSPELTEIRNDICTSAYHQPPLHPGRTAATAPARDEHRHDHLPTYRPGRPRRRPRPVRPRRLRRRRRRLRHHRGHLRLHPRLQRRQPARHRRRAGPVG